MRTIKTKVYQFKELSKEAKKKAIENYKDINVDQDDWNFCIIEDWKSKLVALGYSDIEILYSGFGSQGDGACFTAKVELTEWLKAHGLIKKYNKLYKEQEGYSPLVKITHSYQYLYSTSTVVDRTYYITLSEKAEKQLDEVIALIEKERERIGNKIYKELEDVYFDLISDEAVIETIEANEYEFLENGSVKVFV